MGISLKSPTVWLSLSQFQVQCGPDETRLLPLPLDLPSSLPHGKIHWERKLPEFLLICLLAIHLNNGKAAGQVVPYLLSLRHQQIRIIHMKMLARLCCEFVVTSHILMLIQFERCHLGYKQNHCMVIPF